METVARCRDNLIGAWPSPFKKAKEDVAVLTKELEAYDGEKALLRQAKARLLGGE